MNISKWKIFTKFVFGGGVGGVVDYLLDVLLKALNEAMSSMGDKNREKVTKAIEIAHTVLDWMNKLDVLCPKKWQPAYDDTMDAVKTVIVALSDLNLDREELDKIVDAFKKAVDSWKSDDEATTQA